MNSSPVFVVPSTDLAQLTQLIKKNICESLNKSKFGALLNEANKISFEKYRKCKCFSLRLISQKYTSEGLKSSSECMATCATTLIFKRVC